MQRLPSGLAVEVLGVRGAVVALELAGSVVRPLQGPSDHRAGRQVVAAPGLRLPQLRPQERLARSGGRPARPRPPAASRGRCPLTTMSSKNGASLTSRARPLTRSVSVRPGTRKISPTCGLAARCAAVGAAVAGPLRHGDACVSSRTCTKPAGSPLGETSQVPSAAEVAISRNGDAAIQARSRSCRWSRSLRTAPPDGVPSSSAQLGFGRELGPAGSRHPTTMTRPAACSRPGYRCGRSCSWCLRPARLQQ